MNWFWKLFDNHKFYKNDVIVFDCESWEVPIVRRVLEVGKNKYRMINLSQPLKDDECSDLIWVIDRFFIKSIDQW